MNTVFDRTSGMWTNLGLAAHLELTVIKGSFGTQDNTGMGGPHQHSCRNRHHRDIYTRKEEPAEAVYLSVLIYIYMYIYIYICIYIYVNK